MTYVFFNDFVRSSIDAVVYDGFRLFLSGVGFGIVLLSSIAPIVIFLNQSMCNLAANEFCYSNPSNLVYVIILDFITMLSYFFLISLYVSEFTYFSIAQKQKKVNF